VLHIFSSKYFCLLFYLNGVIVGAVTLKLLSSDVLQGEKPVALLATCLAALSGCDQTLFGMECSSCCFGHKQPCSIFFLVFC
jgi:hypothetical protein